MDNASPEELEKLKRDTGIPHLPTQLTYECRIAVSGKGPRAYDWSDKPHRLIYDLCREIEAAAARRPEVPDVALDVEGEPYTAAQLKDLLVSRDDFLVSRGLFGEYADSLPAKPLPSAPKEGE